MLRNATAFSDENTCLMEVNGTILLQRSHAYYYKVQTQMAVCQLKYCDFVVWAPSLLHIERIKWDEDFCANIFSISRRFFVSVVLPELYAKYFSRQNKCWHKCIMSKDIVFAMDPRQAKWSPATMTPARTDGSIFLLLD